MASEPLVLDIPSKSICSNPHPFTSKGWMQDRRLLPTDWVTRLKAAQIKCEQLKNDFPKDTHAEEAVKAIYK